MRAIAQGCSEYNITVVLKREDCIRALRAVHARFYLSRTTIAMGIIGPGLIGATLLDQLRDQVLLLKILFYCCHFLSMYHLYVISMSHCMLLNYKFTLKILNWSNILILCWISCGSKVVFCLYSPFRAPTIHFFSCLW